MRLSCLLLLFCLLVPVLSYPRVCPPPSADLDYFSLLQLGNLHGNIYEKIQYFSSRYFGDHVSFDALKTFTFSRTHVASMNCQTFKEVLKLLTVEAQDSMRRTLEHQSGRSFHFYPIFRKDFDAQALWDSEIAMASSNLAYFDQANLFLNFAVRDIENFHPSSLEIFENKLEMAKSILIGRRYRPRPGDRSELVESLESIGFNRTGDFETQLKMMIARFVDEAPWEEVKSSLNEFYTVLERSNTTLANSIVKSVSRDVLMEYTERVIQTVEALAGSPDLARGIIVIGQALLDKVRSVDYDEIWVEVYKVFLRTRSRLLEMDLEKIFNELDKLDYAFQHGWWRFITGRWPEFEIFMENLFLTLLSDAFWDRLDQLYLDTVTQVEGVYHAREELLETYIIYAKSALRAVIIYLEEFSNSIEQSFNDIAAEIKKVDVEEPIKELMRTLTSVVGKYYMACYAYPFGYPDFVMLEEKISTFKVYKDLKDLVFYNWPQDKLLPEGTDAFIQKFSNGFWLIVTALLGSCPESWPGS